MRTFLVSFLQLAISLTVIGGILYFAYPLYHPYITYSYCDQPIRYRIDNIDTRFKISEKQFVDDTAAAAAIWNKYYPKPLFIYDSAGELSINMVYDVRQSLNTEVTALEKDVKQGQSALKDQISEYNKLAAIFKSHLDDFNKRVTYWNTQPQTDFGQYDNLLKEQTELQKEGDSLNAMAKKLNQSTAIYNTEVNKLNHSISNYQTALDLRPEEGIYMGDKKRIEIYFNINKDELVHTLAHELGHSLGIDHTEDPKSIMYPYTTETLKLALEDQRALTDYCREHDYIELLQLRLAYLFGQLQTRLDFPI